MNRASRTQRGTIAERVRVQLVDETGQRAELWTRFAYADNDPFAVSVTFLTADPVTWTFARDLLLEGLYEPTGDGDVHVWPCLSQSGQAVVILELSSPDGEVLIQAPVRELSLFAQRTVDAVPVGTESDLVDLDSVIDLLLSGPGVH